MQKRRAPDAAKARVFEGRSVGYEFFTGAVHQTCRGRVSPPANRCDGAGSPKLCQVLLPFGHEPGDQATEASK
jgi:hypothetical protein